VTAMRFLLLFALLLAGCPGGPGPTPPATCMASPCPPGDPGAFDKCEVGAVAITCCAENVVRPACAVDAGILSQTCPGCDGGGPCAWSDGVVVTCQAFAH
jgi:hypothetical protein